MAIKGSFRDDPAFNPLTVQLMCLDTAHQSGDKLQELVRKHTPVKSGALRDSVEQGPMTRPYKTWYKIKVTSADPKAEWIEYGTPPHVIKPREKGGALSIGGKQYAEVNHPGYEGAHMFVRGGTEFEELWAELIAEKNLRKFLGARTVT